MCSKADPSSVINTALPVAPECSEMILAAKFFCCHLSFLVLLIVPGVADSLILMVPLISIEVQKYMYQFKTWITLI